MSIVGAVPAIGRMERAAVVRTDFSDDAAWRGVVDEMLAESPEGWRAYVTVIDDAAFDGLTPDQVLDAITDDYHFGFLLIVDADAIHGDARAVLVVDLFEERGRSFRALLSQVQSVENNLSLANMDFSEFAESVERDGVFRGFDE
jgi:hypothetical protein